MHPAALSDEDLLKQCDLGRGRGSGPGGQHRNKVETTVTVTHRPTGVSAQAGERRSQSENKRVALRRLRLALAVQHREPVPAGEIASDLWISRRQGRRIACNPGHRDYSALLAEALDVAADCRWDPKQAATRLGVSPSQLIKLVKDHPPAFEMWNARRAQRGEHALK